LAVLIRNYSQDDVLKWVRENYQDESKKIKWWSDYWARL